MSRKFTIISVITFAAICFLSVNAQDIDVSAAQNFQQWGAVTLFNGLPSDKIRAAAQTSDGVLWFGTDGGLSKFDGRRVQKVNLGGQKNDKIRALETAPDGTLWIGTENGVFIGLNGQFKHLKNTEKCVVNAILFAENIYLALDGGQILQLNETSENNFNKLPIPSQPLVGSDGNLLKISGLAKVGGQIIAATRSRSLLLIENDRAFEIFSRPRPFFINSIAADRQGKIWLAADANKNDGGLYWLEDVNRPQKIGEQTGNVLAVEPDAADGIWVGTQSNGLFHFRGGALVAHLTFENTAGGLRSNSIDALFIDRENVLWIGTDRGVCRFDGASPLTKTVSEDGNGNFVRILRRTENGQIFAGTNRGLFTFANETWNEAGNFSQKTVYNIGENSLGETVVCTPNGLFGIDGKQFMSGEVRAAANFQNKTYAAVFGRGLIQIDNQTLIFADDSPTAIFADERNLWLGTAKNGVFVFDGKSVGQPETLDGLRAAAIRKITADAENNLWFAAQNGLFLYRNERLETIISNQIVQDVFINGAEIWAATEGGGLFHVRRDNVFGWLVANLNVEQGLPSQKIFSILQVEDSLLIGTNRGTVNYTPSANPPKIIATRVLSQKLYESDELNRKIILDYPQNTLLVEVAGLSSRTFPEQFQYGFLLENSNGEILDKKLSGDSQFAPENLAAGEYRIEIRAFNKDLLASEPLTINFSVARAPFPKTAAALAALLLITLIALVWAIVERRRIVRRNRELAAARFDLANEAERERKRIAGDLHDQTLADLRNLMLMSDKLPSDTMEFRAEVESISTEIRRICEDLSPSVLENVGLFAALEFLLRHTFENGKFSAHDAEENLEFSPNAQMQIYRVAQEILNNLKRHSDAQFVEMHIEISPEASFVLLIKDDGTTFNPNKISSKGRGIANIKSRAALIEAEIEWRESDGGGTIFTLKKSF